MFWAEQHVQWREQDRNALNSQHSDFVRAAQEYGQARRDEVRVAGAQATEMSSAEMLAKNGCSQTSSRAKLDFLIQPC